MPKKDVKPDAPAPPKPQPSKTFAIPDRSALKQKINAPEAKEEDNQDPEQVSLGRNKPFKEEDLTPIWKALLAQREKEEKNKEIRIFQSTISLKDKEVIVNITNEALLPTFEKIKFDLINHLRNQLENDDVVISAQVIEVEMSKMRYTDSEKFEYLKEKHPPLQNLQDKLGLDPEF